MKISSVLIITLFSFSSFASESFFKINIFERNIDVTTSCILKISKNEDPNTVAFYECDKETNLLIAKFDYQSIMDLTNTFETTKHSENKIGALTHFHIEAAIKTSVGDSINFIDAFCDVQFCLIPLGESKHIASSIEAQLNSMPNKPIKRD